MSQSKRRPTIDLGYPTEVHGRISSFASVEEEAAFRDGHDFTDFAAESSPVKVTVGQDLAERLRLRLDHADRQELARRAKAKGIGPSTLARMWLKERLRKEVETEARSG
jgi:hypothetical protein